MPKRNNNFRDNGGQIKIPMEFIEKIDKIVGTGKSVYPSRDEFIKSAVEIKLAELRMSK